MKSREEVANFLNSGACTKKGDLRKPSAWHFGKQDMRVLMDFIYEGKPEKPEEEIKRLA